jgi:aerobic carbon-monoxide dehydrogenase large subunit
LSAPAVNRARGLLGSRVKRVEDPALLRGEGSYVDDIELPFMLHAAVLRSPVAHARIRSVDASAARALDGVHAVLTIAELDQMGARNLPVIWVRPGQRNLANPILARDKVRYVGEPMAVVAAQTRELAEDALDLVDVDLEELPAVVDPLAALESDAPLLHDEWGDNVVVRLSRIGGDVDLAVTEADLVFKERFKVQRYTGIPLETRGVVVSPEQTGRHGQGMTIWSSTQVVHHARDVIANVLNWPENRLRVVASDVGGGFGPKDHVYGDEIAVVALAIATQRPVKWIEDRHEHFLATVHAREQVHDVEVAARNDGTILGVRDRMVANIGAYCSNVGVGPVSLGMEMLPGPYRVPNYPADVIGVVTNKVPAGAYRGFGMTQSTFVMERIVDMVARRLEIDPAEVRRRNLIPADELPYTTVTGMRYDSGDYPRALERALEIVDYEEWRATQASLRAEGRYVGIGIGSYVEAAGFAPSRVLGDLGFAISGYEPATLKMDAQGKVTLSTSISSQGQSHQTTLAQVCASALGVRFEDVRVVQGDTATTPYASAGAIASRGAPIAGGATLLVGRKLREKLVQVAAHLFEAAPEDVEIEESQAFVRGSPTRSIPIQQAAEAALLGHDLPHGMTPGLEEQVVYDPEALTFPYATHVAVVEVDPTTGAVTFLRYAVVHDCGTMINPTVVEGQVLGGLAQGIGGALLEELVYANDGQLVTTSLMDYLLPSAPDIPPVDLEHYETPSPTNPAGIKGMGEGGAIGPPSAIGNAIADALTPFGVEVTETPLGPSKIWSLIEDAKAKSAVELTEGA